MKLYLIRHGMTRGNRERLYYGSTDLPLLPEGIEALKQLRSEKTYPMAPHVYTSGMLRTEQTLEALYGNIPHGVLSDLREMDFGDFEMESYETLKDRPDFQAWITGNNEENPCPNGECGSMVTERALKAIKPILDRDEDTLCVIHGGVIACLLQTWFPRESRFSWTPAPGTGYAVTVQNGIPRSVDVL